MTNWKPEKNISSPWDVDVRENNIGKKWWNDGCGNTKFALECPSDGWVLGRGKLPRKYNPLNL